MKHVLRNFGIDFLVGFVKRNFGIDFMVDFVKTLYLRDDSNENHFPVTASNDGGRYISGEKGGDEHNMNTLQRLKPKPAPNHR